MGLSLDDKLKQLDALEASLEKEYGDGIIVREQYKNIPRISVSSPGLLDITGGGIAKGRIMEIYGPESSGKTTLYTQLAADVQKNGGLVVWIDAEHAFDPIWAHKFGLDTEDKLKFRLVKPETGEDCFSLIEKYAQSGLVEFIVVDSVAAMTPKAELEGEMGDQFMGLHARLMSKGLRKITGIISKTEVAVGFINQIRSKIGVMFGNPETTTGGLALKFYSSIRLEVRKAENITGKDDDEILGIRTRVKSVKNKTSVPYKKHEIDIYFSSGIDIYKEYVDFGVLYQIINKNGAWFSYKNEKIGQGAKNAAQFLRDNPEIFNKIKTQVDMFINNSNNIPVSEEILPNEEDVVKKIIEEAKYEADSLPTEEIVSDSDGSLSGEETTLEEPEAKRRGRPRKN